MSNLVLVDEAYTPSMGDDTIDRTLDAGSASETTGGPAITREEIDAKIEASEARNAALLERAMGEVRTELATLNSSLLHITRSLDDVRNSQRTSFWGVAGLIAAAVAAVLAALSFASDRFGAGVEASSIAQQAAEKAVANYARNLPPPSVSAPPTIGPARSPR